MTRLSAAPATGTLLHAVPIAWVGWATFPVRAYVILEDEVVGRMGAGDRATRRNRSLQWRDRPHSNSLSHTSHQRERRDPARQRSRRGSRSTGLKFEISLALAGDELNLYV